MKEKACESGGISTAKFLSGEFLRSIGSAVGCLLASKVFSLSSDHGFTYYLDEAGGLYCIIT